MKKATRFFITLILGLFSINLSAQKNTNVDSLIQVVNTMQEDTNKVKLLYKISLKFANNNPERHKFYAEQSLELSSKINYLSGISSSCYSLGHYYKSVSLFDKALENVNKGLANAEISNNKHEKAILLSLAGIIYKDKGLYERAAEYYFDVLKIYEEANDTARLAKFKINLGILMFQLQKADKSIEYFESALEYFEKTKNLKVQGKCLMNIANIYYKQHDFNKALVSYLAVDELYKNILPAKRSYAHLYANIGLVYNDLKDFGNAAEYFEKALILYKELGNIRYIAATLNDMGNMRIYQKQFRESIALAKQSLKISEEIDAKAEQIQSYEIIWVSFVGLYDKDSAFYFLNKWQRLQDSVISDKNRKIVTEMETKYETEKKEAEIINLNKEKKLQTAENKIKTYQIFGLSAFIVSIIIVLFFYLKNQKRKQKQKIKDERAIEAENQKERLSKEIHDGTGSDLTGISYKLVSLKEKSEFKNEISEIISEVDRIHQAVSLVSYQASSPDYNHCTLDESVRDLVRKLTKIGAIKINYFSTISLNWTKVSHDFQIAIYRIVQESISNALKHSKAKSVDIQLIQYDKNFNLMIEDNGQGFVPNEITEGLGLRNIRDRLAGIDGTLRIDTMLERGTNLIMDFPTPKK